MSVCFLVVHVLDPIEFVGIKISFAAAGLGGGVLQALSRKSITLREIIASPVCGALSAFYLTTLVVSYLHKIGWPLPEDAAATEHATAFLVGVSAMWIADLVLEAVSRWVKGGGTAVS